MEVIEVTEREIEVIEVIERGPQGPQGAGITTLTTQGDLLYRGSTTGERLPIGTTGQILKVSSGGIPEWGAAPSSGVSSVSGTSPIVSSGGATPAISITAATTSAAGSMSAADKTKLDGIASGAEVNVNADWNASSGDAQILNKPTIPSTAADVGAVPTSRTISAGTGLTGGGDLSANRTLAVTYGTTAGTACQGNDGRIAGIESGSITTQGASITVESAGFQVITGNGTGQINTSDGGSIDTSFDGGSINTRGTGSIEFGELGTRTTLTGTATADRAISLPDAAGTLALTSGYTSGAGALYDYADIPAQSPKIYYDSSASPPWNVTDSQSFREAISCPASGTITNSGLTQATNRILGRTTASTGAIQEITVGGGASLSAGSLTVHAQSHAITSTSDHTATANRVFYSNSSGQVTELALGAANTVLTSNGTTSAPSFAAVSAGATNLWIPASAWIPRTTTGCGVDSTELSTNKVNTDQLLFDTATEEYAQALVMMPSNYNYGTITARFYWTASSGSGGVAFGLRGRAYADDDALDQAQGTGQVTTDTFIVADDLHVTAATSAITLAGTPAANRPVQLEIYRQVSNASDTLGVDARLLGVEVIFN